MSKWSIIEKIERTGIAMWFIAAFLIFFAPSPFPFNIVVFIIIIVLVVVGGLLLIAESHLVRKSHMEWQSRFEEDFGDGIS